MRSGRRLFTRAPIVKSIGRGGATLGRDYSTISLWIASLPTDLVADGNSYRGECYNDIGVGATNDGEFDDRSMNIAGHNTSIDYNITLTTAPGHSFRDHASKATNRLSYNQSVGVGIKSDNGHTNLLAASDPYTTISNLQIWTMGSSVHGLNANANNVTFANIIAQGTLRDNRYSMYFSLDGASNSVFYNCLAIVMRDYTFGLSGGHGFQGGSYGNYINCTSVKPFENSAGQVPGSNDGGFALSYGQSLVRNCMSFGFIYNYNQQPGVADGHNCTDTAVISGTTGNLVNQFYGDQFVNPSQVPPTAMDFRLKNSSNGLNTGVDVTTVTLQGGRIISITDDMLGNARPTNGLWEIGCEESPLIYVPGYVPPPPDFFDLYAEATYRPPQRYPQHLRRVVVPPYQPPPPPPTIKTFYATNIAAVSPGWWSLLQEGGTAPTAAASSSGYNIQKVTTALGPFWRSRLGVSGASQLSATSGTTSYIAAPVAGPIVGTGNTNTTAGDSFRSPVAYSGNFPSGNWTIALGFRTGATTVAGAIRCRVWASTSTSATSPRELTTALLTGSTVTMNATTSTFTSSITWAAPAITLTNEYIYFQLEWNSTTNSGNSNNSNATIWVGSGSSIVTTLFTPTPPAVVGRMVRTTAPDTISADGTVGAAVTTGSLTATQQNQGISATATTGAVTGSLTATQQNQGISATGTIGAVTGALGRTQDPQGISATGTVGLSAVTGNLSATQQNQGISATGKVDISATLGRTQDPQGINATGTVLSGIIGNLTATQANHGMVGWGTSPNALLTSYVNAGGATGLNGEAGLIFQSSANTDYNRIGLRAKPGSTGLHTIKLYNYDTKAVLQTASVDLTGATSGQFYYTSMPPTTLVSGTNYALMTATIASEQFPSNCPVTVRNSVPGQTFGTFYDTVWHPILADACYYGVDLDYVISGITGALNATQDPQGINASATVAVGATLTATQQNQGISANVGVDTSATLTATQANQGINAHAASTPSGYLSATQQDQGINAGGGPKPNGALTATQQNQGINAGAATTVLGNLARAQDPNGISATGTVLSGTQANLNANQQNQGISATGTLTPISVGVLNATQQNQGISATAKVDVTGTLGRTQDPQGINAGGGPKPDGALTATQQNQGISATGTTGAITGALSRAQDPQGINAGGASTVRGTLTATQQNQGISATGSVYFGIAGNLNKPQDPQGISATGTVSAISVGNLTATQQNQGIQATGGPVAYGNLTRTQGSQVITPASGGPTVAAALSRTQEDQTIIFHGTIGGMTGTLNRTQDPQGINARGGPAIRVTFTATQENQTALGLGSVGVAQARVILMA
jgi:hypothetical protein